MSVPAQELQKTQTSLSIIDNVNLQQVSATMQKIAQFQAVVQKTLKKDHDYGVIPGTGNKPTLLKPGAEKILMLMGLTSEYDVIEKVQDYEGGFFAFTVKCTLSRGDIKVTEGVGHANTREKRYTSGRQQDPYTLANTVLKMAKKRCLGSTTPVLVKTSKNVLRTNLSKLYDIYEKAVTPLWLPGIDGTWRKVIKMAREEGRQVVKLGLSDGSFIRATLEHRFPTADGLKHVSELVIGDKLLRSNLPDPGLGNRSADRDFGYVSGLYLAEGHCYRRNSVRFTIHTNEITLCEAITNAAMRLGSTVNTHIRSESGNTRNINVTGQAFEGLMRQFINGSTCYNKHLSNYSWAQGTGFLLQILRGYLDGDGHYSKREGRHPHWLIGFSGANYDLADDIRTLAAIGGYRLCLKRVHKDNTFGGKPTFTGWIKPNIETYNQKNLEQIVSIEMETKPAVVYDVEVDGDHLFCLANGIQTHNSQVDAVLTVASLSEIFTQDLEDYEDDIPQPQKPIQYQPKNQQQKNNTTNTIQATENQLKKIYAMSKELGIEKETMKAIILERYGKDSSKELSKYDASDLIEYLGKLESSKEIQPAGDESQAEYEVREPGED